jgi:phage-related protein
VGVAIQVRFFQTPNGNTPALDFIRKCTKEEQTIIGADLRQAQNDWAPGPPLTKSFGAGLHEVRITLPTRIVRLMVCTHDGLLIVLSAFFKTTQQTPASEITLARARMKALKE